MGSSGGGDLEKVGDVDVDLQNYVEKLMSSVPKVKGWGAAGYLYQYQGFWYPAPFLLGTIWAQQNFKPKDSDILVATAPKSGTTWMKALLFSIINRNRDGGSISSPSHPLRTKNPHKIVPFLESLSREIISGENPATYLDSLPSPRLFGTHVPYTCLPSSILSNSRGQIVYVARNPNDVFVSHWMMSQKLQPPPPNQVPMEEAFEMFCGRGVSTMGPVWDHILEYWKASLEHPDQVLFLKYEDLKRDTEYHVKRVAKFIGHPFSLEEERQGVIQEIINLCSFQNLSKLEVNKSETYQSYVTAMSGSKTNVVMSNSVFFRRGEVGDSKNHLTPEMLHRLDKITEEKLGTSGLKF